MYPRQASNLKPLIILLQLGKLGLWVCAPPHTALHPGLWVCPPHRFTSRLPVSQPPRFFI